jgi:hypothetical protein
MDVRELVAEAREAAALAGRVALGDSTCAPLLVMRIEAVAPAVRRLVQAAGSGTALGQLRDEELVRVLDDLLQRARRLTPTDRAAAAKVEKAAALVAALVEEAAADASPA